MEIRVTVTETVYQHKVVTVDAFVGDDVEELARQKALQTGEWSEGDSDGFEYQFDSELTKNLPMRPEHQIFFDAFVVAHISRTGMSRDDFYAPDVIEEYYSPGRDPAEAVAEDMEKFGLEDVSR